LDIRRSKQQLLAYTNCHLQSFGKGRIQGFSHIWTLVFLAKFAVPTDIEKIACNFISDPVSESIITNTLIF
jgi:hypothetical protein